ncbi:MAG: hypothetical protein UR96_C0001G0010 [candidate division WS6 bacterium GW2011_GWC1_36_11]|uniref:Uncharacterized protein n=3 Tax=Candidatus Dojkabacteria TaxID=74243 RepID=A0A0G0DFR8_9BACT|nr:MAG: hypothetical protein UR96_C0001G0010 [candidate division WS6 bacterium GW2011_GWC1_36_11]KKQ04559.1 MAG: hypothetical protein US14_C0006G0002 [candidate division WS6 bacterium GW2011_WS6_36_26]KKQ11137.1 MAG: hypothetical protein US24_C0040G0004 [candidate division WS6 bacterium GW2011_GWC2_36_7]KKQ17817.1 MAG: hypothetical protein US29_C0005G0004 [candidate division WS6 bacterium GW2011_GWF1_36_8]HAM37219.1 hypothetical protein [Patescibacteria group bacterium]
MTWLSQKVETIYNKLGYFNLNTSVMIKSIREDVFNRTNQFYYECENCGKKGVLTITNLFVNIGNQAQIEELQNEPCPHCDKILSFKKNS